MRSNINDITLGIIAYAISIKLSWTGTIALCGKKRAHNLYPAKSVEDFNCLTTLLLAYNIANIFALTIHIDF